MKKLGKLLLAIFILLSSVISNFIGVGSKVEAATFFVNEADLRQKATLSGTITYNGEEIYTTYVYYVKDGHEYPAYCISPAADGVGEYGSYTVTVDSLLNDTKLWRVITNGYPYKTVASLGCRNEEEAYVATKHAVYCAMLGREASWYGSLGEKGDRVLNAMSQIMNAANSSSYGKPSGNIEIIERNENWLVDNNSNCVYKTFSISASTTYSSYDVSLEGNYPSGTTILSTNNTPKTTFSSGEQFKIIIPMSALNTNGNFKVSVSSKLNTKPVLYGKAPAGSGLQDYALTTLITEDAEGSKSLNYSKNATKVEILKKDEKTLSPLKGVEFRILDKNKKAVYTDLVTNAQGKIVITGMQPGKYFLEETKSLDGYVKYDKQIEFDLEYNQELTITVNNTLEKNKETESNKKNINVVQNRENVVIRNNEENIQKQDSEKNTQIVNTEKNIVEINNVENDYKKTSISNTNDKTTNIEKLNSINLENKNDNESTIIENIRTRLNNENVNINKNLFNAFLNASNKNSNINENLFNLLIDMLNENSNENTNIQNQIIDQNDRNKMQNKQDTQINVNAEISNGNAGAINNQNVNTNVQSNNINLSSSLNNEIIKLPKTGM